MCACRFLAWTYHILPLSKKNRHCNKDVVTLVTLLFRKLITKNLFYGQSILSWVYIIPEIASLLSYGQAFLVWNFSSNRIGNVPLMLGLEYFITMVQYTFSYWASFRVLLPLVWNKKRFFQKQCGVSILCMNSLTYNTFYYSLKYKFKMCTPFYIYVWLHCKQIPLTGRPKFYASTTSGLWCAYGRNIFRWSE